MPLLGFGFSGIWCMCQEKKFMTKSQIYKLIKVPEFLTVFAKKAELSVIYEIGHKRAI